MTKRQGRWRNEWVLRVPGLPIRDCEESCNCWVPRRSKMSAIDMTAKKFFEHLYLVPGLGTFGPRINCFYASTTPTVHSTTISRFPCKFKFFSEWPLNFFCKHDSPSNLAESWYRDWDSLLETGTVPGLPIRGCAHMHTHKKIHECVTLVSHTLV